MTISQLEYILAIAEHKHFGQAAEDLSVAQSTLSMMVKKLEDELGVVLFDRNSKPIEATDIGGKVLAQAKHVLAEYHRLQETVKEYAEELSGEYRLGVIPTIGPYLIPQLVAILVRDYPELKLTISEAQTDELIQMLSDGSLDAAILATPLKHEKIQEYPLYYEEFYVYGEVDKHGKEFVIPADINPNKLWLLEEGHCLRSQIVNLCELKENTDEQIHFEGGGLETLIELVRHYNGLTILPELALKTMPKKEQKRVSKFNKPAPYREVSLVTHKHAAKFKFIEAIQDVVEEIIPLAMRKLKQTSRIIEIYES